MGHVVQPYRVLIVDDDPVSRRLEQEILDSPNYLVTEASSGQAALDALREHSFDVVLLDKRMPGMDGGDDEEDSDDDDLPDLEDDDAASGDAAAAGNDDLDSTD